MHTTSRHLQGLGIGILKRRLVRSGRDGKQSLDGSLRRFVDRRQYGSSCCRAAGRRSRCQVAVTQHYVNPVYRQASLVAHYLRENCVSAGTDVLRRARDAGCSIGQQSHPNFGTAPISRPGARTHTPAQSLVAIAHGADFRITLAPAESLRSLLIALAQMLARPRAVRSLVLLGVVAQAAAQADPC